MISEYPIRFARHPDSIAIAPSRQPSGLFQKSTGVHETVSSLRTQNDEETWKAARSYVHTPTIRARGHSPEHWVGKTFALLRIAHQ
jgi:hypothetical protein